MKDGPEEVTSEWKYGENKTPCKLYNSIRLYVPSSCYIDRREGSKQVEFIGSKVVVDITRTWEYRF